MVKMKSSKEKCWKEHYTFLLPQDKCRINLAQENEWIYALTTFYCFAVCPKPVVIISIMIKNTATILINTWTSPYYYYQE